MTPPPDPRLVRWRLVLGRYAESQLPASGLYSTEQQRMEQALDYLYGREYDRRHGLHLPRRDQGDGETPDRHGSLDASRPTVPDWLAEVRRFFPRQTVQTIEHHALARYGLRELLTDPVALAKLEPNPELLRTLLGLRHQLAGPVLPLARRLVHQITEELRRRLARDIERVLAGRLHRQWHSPVKQARNLDWRDTLRRNLKHYDPARRQLLLEEVRFFASSRRQLGWEIILCVDQSGSMTDSVIHSAVMASVLAGLPTLRVRLVVFDTAIVDLSDHLDDPLVQLLGVQLGGGTNIGQALAYCRQLLRLPRRTILILVSDFYEGASPAVLLDTTRRLAEDGVRLLGLAALDRQAQPTYDRQMAERLADAGMSIAALTPEQLAEWLAKALR